MTSRGGVLLVDKGALEREIDEAGDELAGECRDLPQQQLVREAGCNSLSTSCTPRVGLVDLVEEQEARNVLIFQFAQDDLQLRNFLLVRLADHDGGIDRRQHRAHVVDEFDRAGAIEEGVAVAHERRGGDGQLDAHLVMARFLAGVAYRVTGLDRTLPRDRAGARENRLKQGGFAALKRADQRYGAGTRRAAAIVAVRGHEHLPLLGPLSTAGHRLWFQAPAGQVKGRDTVYPARTDTRCRCRQRC